MKVRIGVSLGPAAVPAVFGDAVDRVEALGVDSLWLSEMVFGSLVEPFAGMAYALSRTTRLKVGTGVAVLPGRQPVLVAKHLASLAGLAPGRVLPVFGLQPARAAERGVFEVPDGRRAAVFEESLQLIRLLLTQEQVSFRGEFFIVDGAHIGPLPARPLDIWLGGSAPGALSRVGRLADGWLGSLLTPDEARAARETIQAAASAAGREVEADHFGISLAVAPGWCSRRPGYRHTPAPARQRPRRARPRGLGGGQADDRAVRSRPGSASSSSGQRHRQHRSMTSSVTSPAN